MSEGVAVDPLEIYSVAQGDIKTTNRLRNKKYSQGTTFLMTIYCYAFKMNHLAAWCN
jgi:hypothetical protein